MALRKCIFDHSEEVVDWLHKGGFRDITPHDRSHCWISSLIGQASARSLKGHWYCVARPGPPEKLRELWIIHGDEFHNQSSPIYNATSIVSAPSALLFVSYGGGPDFFAERLAEIIEVKVSGQNTGLKIPVFFHRGGLKEHSDIPRFRELLTVFEVALQEVDQCNGDPLAPFRKAASEAQDASWPYDVGFRDDTDALFLLWAAMRLKQHAVAKKLLRKDSLRIARSQGDNLDLFLLHEHREIFIPLSCRSILAGEMHKRSLMRPGFAGERETRIRQLKLRIIDKWFLDNKNAAATVGLSSHWASIKQLAVQDVEKWTLRTN